ncbi:Holliday junction DNA helicase RuvA [candidate division WOR-3 bacterium]|uniref:Holliday junction branch migration complex subunit RuvA n=1 Tax=candidate division WOR-3 bacterium TaxID=2052148 RepID=A0A9D5KD02_UNCW3|nr:Holliday junction DNA helicase RuvA [candidate division WOR-3 bacterium]MBD3365361.1 Holliday junction DNA helicase RuvA [candidate division WOR-3 bacterium]
MIGYLEGALLRRDDEQGQITLLVSQVGYEVRLPDIVWRELGVNRMNADGQTQLKLFIYQHQTERSPRPLLIGFTNVIQREFFERFISVPNIGPTAAAKALNLPVRSIARAIEERDLGILTKLSGIGRSKAEAIVAALNGKMAKFALIQDAREPVPEVLTTDELREQVIEVLVSQLGYRKYEATLMVDESLKEKPDIQTPEELFDEVYRRKHR